MTNKEAIEQFKERLAITDYRKQIPEYKERRCRMRLIDADGHIEKSKKVVSEKKVISEWIPVSERLPENSEDVLLTVKDDSADSPIYYSSVGWYYNGIWIVGNTVCYQVIAWMPLPEPYKEGE